jgi:hypothetical protein
MDLADFFNIADRYRNLGDSVQDQMKEASTLDPAIMEECNPNALRMAAEFLNWLAHHSDGDQLADEARDVVNEINKYLREMD